MIEALATAELLNRLNPMANLHFAERTATPHCPSVFIAVIKSYT